MKVLRCQNKEELMERLSEIDKSHREVYVSLRPTQEIVDKLVDEAEALEELKCPESLYYQVGEKVNQKLEEEGIELNPGDFSPGRPRKYSETEIQRMIEMREQGTPVKEISEQMDVPIRTIYFYLNKRME